MIIREPSLILSARVAAKIERALTDAEAKARRNGVRTDPDVAQVLVEIHDLAAAWWHVSAASACLDRPRKRRHHRRR